MSEPYGWPMHGRVSAVVLALALLGAGSPALAADPDRATSEVLHRVVWATASRDDPGIHVRSMERDGSDVRASYDWPHGFTLDLMLSPDGRRVAFSPCCRPALPLLVVARVRGGKALEPVRKRPARYDFVDGIAWSPNGRKLVFAGISGPAGERVVSFWIVRPNGKGLRKVLSLPPGEAVGDTVSLGWTEDGILYSDRGRLWLVRSGAATLVMRDVGAFRISGDGSRLLMHRSKGKDGSIWLTDPDGTHRRKVVDQDESPGGAVYYDLTPSYDASEVLALRSGPAGYELVTWRVADGPSSASVLELPDPYTAATTWN